MMMLSFFIALVIWGFETQWFIYYQLNYSCIRDYLLEFVMNYCFPYTFVHLTFRGFLLNFNIDFLHFAEQKFKIVPSLLINMTPRPIGIS